MTIKKKQVAVWRHKKPAQNMHTSVPSLDTVPDMPGINNILTTIGHRSGHPSGLDESSRRNSTTFLFGIAFRVYLVFSHIHRNTGDYQILTETVISRQKACRFSKIKAPAASPKGHKCGLGIPIHIKDVIYNISLYICIFICRS